jgi:hypothetical protein
LDKDYSVMSRDFGMLAERWLQQDCNIPGWCGGADMDFSGIVDAWDLGLFSDNWLVTDSWWLAPNCHWKLDEGSGTIAYDCEGHYDGVLYGNTTWTEGPMEGALAFDGDADYVRTTYEEGPEEYTVSLWYNLAEDIHMTTFAGYRSLASKTGDEQPTVDLWEVWFTPAGLGFANEKSPVSNYAGVYFSQAAFLKNQWHHVVVTGTKTEGKVYYDGQLKAAANNDFVTGAWDDSVPFDIARPYNGTSDRFFNGKIDDMRIYERVLSEEEIFGLYILGIGRRAFNPEPTDGAAGINVDADLRWSASYGATSRCLFRLKL